jgi:hypothetical protein
LVVPALLQKLYKGGEPTMTRYTLTKHASNRLIERGIKVDKFFTKDLSMNNIHFMYINEKGYEVRHTKNNLKIVLYGNKVITIYKTRSRNLKNELKKINKY